MAPSYNGRDDFILERLSGQTSGSCFVTREIEQPAKTAKQMTANSKEADAARSNTTDWYSIDWAKAEPIVRRLQSRIVKAVSGSMATITASRHTRPGVRGMRAV